MSFSQILGRQIHFSTGVSSVSQRWLLKNLDCHYQDEIIVQGRLQGDAVPPFACKFSPDGMYGHLLAVADEDGSVQLLDTRKLLSEALVSELVCHRNAIFDISWLPGGKKLLTGSGDQTVCLWDVVTGTHLGLFRFHTGSVKSVESNKNEPSMFVSGCRDGAICIWDIRCSSLVSGYRPVNIISMAHKLPIKSVPKRKKGRDSSGDTKISVTALLFQGDDKIISGGAGGGTVKLWDIRRIYSSFKSKLPSPWLTLDAVESSKGKLYGFSSLAHDTYQSFIFATCKDSIIYKYSSAGLITKPVGAFSGCDVSSFYVKSCVSPDNKFLLSGSSCGNGFIWEIDKPEAPPLILSGQPEEVTAVDWGPSLDKLVTCSERRDVRIWRMRREDKVKQWEITGTCNEYTGEDHLKARNAMRYYDVEKETSPSTRTPLQLLQTKNGGEVDFNIREDHVTILEKEASLSFQEVKRRKQESEKRSRTSSLKQKVRQRVTVKRSRSQSLLGTYFKPTASPGASPGASPP